MVIIVNGLNIILDGTIATVKQSYHPELWYN